MLKPNATSITLTDLDKSYGSTEVLQGVDLTVEAGEFLVLVGPSGCGKSTLLRCIAGLEEITAGQLRIGGRICNNVKPKDRDLAMVFQSYALYPHMTVGENVGFSLTVRKIDESQVAERVDHAANLLGIDDLLDRYPKELSGGQRQRVAVGRAIVRNPRAFLFDEPLSNLDAALRTQMRLELKKLHRDLAATMVYVTHDQVEAMTLADRIAILNDGDLQQVGTPREVYETPANRFVAGFIGSPSMNFLQATLRDGRAVGAGFDLSLPERLEEEATGEAEIGVRPTALQLGGDADGEIDATVDVVEPLGSEAYLHAILANTDSSQTEIVAEVPADRARRLEPGQPVSFAVDPSDVHVFDPQTGVAR